MEKIRGVSCDYSVTKLLEKELVAIVGRSEGPGHPLLYGTSEKFMDYFGLKNITDLPKPKDFKEPDNEIGEKAPIDEDAPVPETQSSKPAEEMPNKPSATDEPPKPSAELSTEIEQGTPGLKTELQEEEVQGEATQPKEESNTADNDHKSSLDAEESTTVVAQKEEVQGEATQPKEAFNTTENEDKTSLDVEESATLVAQKEEVQGEATQPKEASSTAEKNDKTSLGVEESGLVGEEKIPINDGQDLEKIDTIKGSISDGFSQKPTDNTQNTSIEASEIRAESSLLSEDPPKEEILEKLANLEEIDEIIDEESDIDKDV